MKTVLLAATVAFATPAWSFNPEQTIHLINDADYACTAGENHDGEKISDEDIKRACLDVVRLLGEMKSNGFCYDKAALEWFKCA